MKKLILLLACVTALMMAFVTGCELSPKQSNVESLPEQSASEEIGDSSNEDSSIIEDSSNPDEGDHTHDYKAVVTSPTCTASGYAVYTCTICGDYYISDRVNALGHSYESVVTAPTCIAQGFTTYTCSDCGNSYTANLVNALGHSWTPATTSAPKTCKTCGATEGDKLPEGSGEAMETLYVSYIDVGQGDSMLIKLGDCDIIIDGGNTGYGPVVNSYLKSQNVDDIELMINTHLDTDHFVGLNDVLSSYVVEDFWRSNFEKSNGSITTFKNNVTKEGLSWDPVATGTTFTYEGLTLTVLYNGTGASSSNDSSLLISLEYGDFRFLFTGDLSKNVESKLVKDSSINLSCDVLKVGHHGSASSSTSAFLKATGAKYGVICVGAGNSYGHPTATAMNNLKAAGITYYRTDLDGDVVFSTNGVTLTIPDGSTVASKAASASKVYAKSTSIVKVNAFIANKKNKQYGLLAC